MFYRIGPDSRGLKHVSYRACSVLTLRGLTYEALDLEKPPEAFHLHDLGEDTVASEYFRTFSFYRESLAAEIATQGIKGLRVIEKELTLGVILDPFVYLLLFVSYHGAHPFGISRRVCVPRRVCVSRGSGVIVRCGRLEPKPELKPVFAPVVPVVLENTPVVREAFRSQHVGYRLRI